MEVINEALVKPDTIELAPTRSSGPQGLSHAGDTIELAPTRRLMLDACGCTGNSSCT